MNSINLSGRITEDPSLRRTNDGTGVCSFSIAVKRPHQKDVTDFISCVAWRQSAEFLCQYGHKGDVVTVSGYLTSRKWTDKNGNNRISWEVTCENLELLSSKKSEAKPANTGYQVNFEPMDGTDAELPF